MKKAKDKIKTPISTSIDQTTVNNLRVRALFSIKEFFSGPDALLGKRPIKI